MWKLTDILTRMALIVMLSVAPVYAQDSGSRKIETLEFRDTSVGEAIRLISRISGANIFATRQAASREFTMTVNSTTVRGVVSSIARVSGLSHSYDEENSAFMLMTNEQFASDVVITRNAETRIFNLRHQNVVSAAKVVESLFGSRVALTVDTSDPDRLQISDGGIQSSRMVNGDTTNNNNNNNDRDDSNFDIADIDPKQLQKMIGLSPDGKELSLSELASQLGVEPRIYLTINREHNLLYVRTADRQAMRDIVGIIQATDRPTKQVLLEVRVMALDLDEETRSVFNFGLSDSSSTSHTSPSGAVTTGGSGAEAGGFTRDGGGLFFQFISNNLSLQLEALERDSKARTLSTPMLAASNNSPARLFVGSEAILARGFSSETTTGTSGASTTSTSTAVELREVGQSLEILPRINADDTVTLVIEQENSTVIEEGGRVPIVDSSGSVTEVAVDTITTARVGGTVTAKTGTTIAVGGLIRDASASSADKTPILGNVPILGLMFRGDSASTERSELVLLITPHIYSGGKEGERLARERLSRNSRNSDLDTRILAENPHGVPAVTMRGQQQHYVPMTRYAAAMRHGILPSNTGVYRGIDRVEIVSGGSNQIGAGGGIKLFGSSAIKAEAVESWKKRNLYVTALVLTNTSAGAQPIKMSSLRGSWLAATAEAEVLKPRNQQGSRTYLYLISNRPYDDVIADLQAGGGL